MNVVGAVGISLVFMAIGGGLLFYARNVARKAQQSLSWPATEGVISHAAVLFRTRDSAQANNAADYRADIAYRFKVKGRDYTSSQITLMDYSSSSSANAEGIVTRYPDGSTVKVFYNPQDPSESVLEPGPTRGILILQLIGGLFAVAGAFIFIMGLSGRVH